LKDGKEAGKAFFPKAKAESLKAKKETTGEGPSKGKDITAEAQRTQRKD
jgi:hypothetical protein